MVWISLDELLEKVMLKLYKQWDRPALSPVRPLLDDERLRLSNALRTLASANPAQSEDAMILYLEQLATLEIVRNIAAPEYEQLEEVKQALVRSRRPSMRLRGARAKQTNLSPARMQTLLAMLEALDPPAYAVTRMYFPENLEELSTLLEAALVMLYDAWDELALETRGAILRTVNTIRVGLMEEAGQQMVTVRSVVETLHQFEAMPEVMYVSRDAFLAGKVDTAPESPFRFNAMVVVSEKLANMLTNPPPITPEAGQEPTSMPASHFEPGAQGPAEGVPGTAHAAEPSLAGELSAEGAGIVGQGEQPDATVEPVQPSLSPRPAVSPSIERNFHTDVRFPQQVRMGDEVPLVVRLTRAPVLLSRVEGQVRLEFGQPDQPEYVEVVVLAHGFSEATGTWSRTLAVYSDRDSQAAIFLLQAGTELGDTRLTLDFYHKGRYLGSTGFMTRIVEKPPAAVGGVTVDTPGLAARFVQEPPPPADLELRIVRGSRENELHFMLHSTRAGVGYHWRSMGQVTLDAETPQAYVETLFAELSAMPASPIEELDEADTLVDAARMGALGQQLFQDLFPPELQQEFWTRILPRRRNPSNPKGVISSLMITSDEAWIPWEMVKPYRMDPASGEEQSAGYLGETFQVARWLAGRGPADYVQVQRAGLVAPSHGLIYAQREEAYFRQLPARSVEVDGPLRSLVDVRQLMNSGGVQLLHFAAHGRYEGENDDLSPFSLDDGALTLDDLRGEGVAGLRRERPLVFLNMCHTARLGFSLTHLGDWAQRLIHDAAAGAFVGTLWEVNDRLAAEFAIAFYDRLLAGDTLGQAFYTARVYVRDRQPDNPAWLAYVLYGDPNSKVVWGAEGMPIQPEPEPEVEEAEEVWEEEPAEPSPAYDIDELAAFLESSLADVLPDLVRRTISPAVQRAVQRLNAEEDEQGGDDEQLGDEQWEGEQSNGEGEAANTDANWTVHDRQDPSAEALSDEDASSSGTASMDASSMEAPESDAAEHDDLNANNGTERNAGTIGGPAGGAASGSTVAEPGADDPDLTGQDPDDDASGEATGSQEDNPRWYGDLRNDT